MPQPSSTAPIGVFDSGLGGLTVARAIIDQLPGESIIYVGDNARGPYGPRTLAEVRSFTLEIMDELVAAGVKASVMVSLSMVKNQGINVNLPVASTSTAQDRKAAVTITVTEEGDVYLDKEKISFDLLPKHLKRLKLSNPDVKIFINGDEKAYFGRAIQILDEVRVAGITKVSIQTKGADSQKNDISKSN